MNFLKKSFLSFTTLSLFITAPAMAQFPCGDKNNIDHNKVRNNFSVIYDIEEEDSFSRLLDFADFSPAKFKMQMEMYKKEINITESQENEWDEFVEALKPMLESQFAINTDQKKENQDSIIMDLEEEVKFLQQLSKNLNRIKIKFEPLLNVLNEKQKKMLIEMSEDLF